MFKNLLKITSILLVIIILFISYLSIFGIKTNKFNEIIKSQILKKDNRINLKLDDIYIKLNIRERSFFLNSSDIDLLIFNEKQELSNVNIFIGLDAIFKQEDVIKKIVINSKENKVRTLLKFIKAYKINIPAIYLENIIQDGNIIYNVIVEYEENNTNQIELSGKIIDANINLFGKEKFENIDFNFKYKNKNLNLTDLKLKYKDVNFTSENITTKIRNDVIDINGDIKSKIDLNLISKFSNYDLKKFIDKKILFNSKSNFSIKLNNKFKLQDYNLESKIDIKDLNINLGKNNLNNYIKELDNKIIIDNGILDFKINKKKNISININSEYILDKKNKPKKLIIKYTKINSIEKFQFDIDLSEYEIIVDEINFNKKSSEEFFLETKIKKNKKMYIIENFKVSGKNNKFNFKNIKIGKNFKVNDFQLIQAKYLTKNNFINDIKIQKKNNIIKLVSKNLDVGVNIENSLKGTNKKNFFDIFENLNSTINIDIKSAKVDNEHNLNDFNGQIIIKNNKVDKAKLTAFFDSSNNFIFTKDEIDGKKVTTIFSDLAKPFVKKFDFIKEFEDGKFDYTSTEVSKNLSKSELRIYDFKLHDMPALTKLLSLASLQGIADLATGQGIRFNEFDMFFENSKNLIKINEIYALGPAISILMEGYVEKNKLISLRGTLVPATTINKTIAKIPLLGNILVGEKVGEGVFGVSFKIKGPPNDLDTKVNPIKTLTPRFITRTLDKIKKN